MLQMDGFIKLNRYPDHKSDILLMIWVCHNKSLSHVTRPYTTR